MDNTIEIDAEDFDRILAERDLPPRPPSPRLREVTRLYKERLKRQQEKAGD